MKKELTNVKALTYQGKEHMEVKEVPAPSIQDERDVIVRITATGICGSDLHLYKNGIPADPGYIVGHEPMGIVEETGSQVKRLKKGDRVVILLTSAAVNVIIASTRWKASVMNQTQTLIQMPAAYSVSRSLTVIIPAGRLNICVFLLLISLLFWFRQTAGLKMSRSCFCQMSC